MDRQLIVPQTSLDGLSDAHFLGILAVSLVLGTIAAILVFMFSKISSAYIKFKIVSVVWPVVVGASMLIGSLMMNNRNSRSQW